MPAPAVPPQHPAQPAKEAFSSSSTQSPARGSKSGILEAPEKAVISMDQAVVAPERHETVGVMKCKHCKGDVFSVTDLEDNTPIRCDRYGAVVGKWADVRALTHLPEKQVLERTRADIFEPSYRGVAQLSLVGID